MARFEVITGADRQRHWSDDDKLSILREAFSPGAVVAAVARRHDIRVQQIYYWRKKFSAPEATPKFLPVSVLDDSLPGVSPTDIGKTVPPSLLVLIEISLSNGRGLKVPADLDRSTLTSLIACVEAA